MITKELFGRTPEGNDVYAYTLSNDSKVSAKICNMGGIIVSLWVEGKDGVKRDVVCGFDDLDGYLNAAGYQGAIIGRVTNRIKKGKFTLDDVEYNLAINCEDFCAHGGNIGFNRRVWGAKAVDGPQGIGCRVSCAKQTAEHFRNLPGIPGSFLSGAHSVAQQYIIAAIHSGKPNAPVTVRPVFAGGAG